MMVVTVLVAVANSDAGDGLSKESLAGKRDRCQGRATRSIFPCHRQLLRLMDPMAAPYSLTLVACRRGDPLACVVGAGAVAAIRQARTTLVKSRPGRRTANPCHNSQHTSLKTPTSLSLSLSASSKIYTSQAHLYENKEKDETDKRDGKEEPMTASACKTILLTCEK